MAGYNQYGLSVRSTKYLLTYPSAYMHQAQALVCICPCWTCLSRIHTTLPAGRGTQTLNNWQSNVAEQGRGGLAARLALDPGIPTTSNLGWRAKWPLGKRRAGPAQSPGSPPAGDNVVRRTKYEVHTKTGKCPTGFEVLLRTTLRHASGYVGRVSCRNRCCGSGISHMETTPHFDLSCSSPASPHADYEYKRYRKVGLRESLPVGQQVRPVSIHPRVSTSLIAGVGRTAQRVSRQASSGQGGQRTSVPTYRDLST